MHWLIWLVRSNRSRQRPEAGSAQCVRSLSMRAQPTVAVRNLTSYKGLSGRVII